MATRSNTPPKPYLGFGTRDEFKEGNYLDIAKHYGVRELEHEHEAALEQDFHKVFFHNPVKSKIGIGIMRIGYRWKCMNNISQ